MLLKISLPALTKDQPVTEKTAKKYTCYFYKSSVPNVHPFANPMQEFWSLDEARTFAQNAADNPHIAIADSFRIESGDGKVNEHWGRRDGRWQLLGQPNEI